MAKLTSRAEDYSKWYNEELRCSRLYGYQAVWIRHLGKDER